MYPPLPIPHQIFNKCVYSCPSSIKSSTIDGSTASSLIVASASNPDSPHVAEFSSSGKCECDVKVQILQTCSHTVAAAAAAEHE